MFKAFDFHDPDVMNVPRCLCMRHTTLLRLPSLEQLVSASVHVLRLLFVQQGCHHLASFTLKKPSGHSHTVATLRRLRTENCPLPPASALFWHGRRMQVKLCPHLARRQTAREGGCCAAAMHWCRPPLAPSPVHRSSSKL